MTDEQILEKLGMQNANEEIKASTLQSVNHVVELRMLSVLAEMISEDQAKQLEDMENSGESHDAIFKWLSDQVANVNKLYESAVSTYLDELIAKQNRLGL